MIPLIRGRGRTRSFHAPLVEASPLRRVDARAKLVVSLAASLAVMSPWQQLLAFMAVLAAFLGWARLLPAAGRQVWRIKWVLALLFVVDWVLIGPELALTITLRLIVLTAAFSLFFATTTPGELCLALEQLRIPYRYAFSISLAYQSLELLSGEWRAIHEAQRARGAWRPPAGWSHLIERVRDLVALSVPAIVLATKRAWAVTEAAYARGFDSPHRRPYHRPVIRPADWLITLGAAMVVIALFLWR